MQSLFLLNKLIQGQKMLFLLLQILPFVSCSRWYCTGRWSVYTYIPNGLELIVLLVEPNFLDNPRVEEKCRCNALPPDCLDRNRTVQDLGEEEDCRDGIRARFCPSNFALLCHRTQAGGRKPSCGCGKLHWFQHQQSSSLTDCAVFYQFGSYPVHV